MDRLDVVVVGGANTDFLVRGPSLPRAGSTVEGDTFQEAPGGKGANQAVGVARLGASVAFIGCLGRDQRGEAILARLADEGVDTSAVRRDADEPTGVALVMVDGAGRKQILTAPGANRRLGAHHVSSVCEVIAAARVVLLQLEVPFETVATAARLGKAAGARVVLDPAPPRAITNELLQDTDVIRPNDDEAEALTNAEVVDQPSARLAAQNLIRRGVGAAIIGAPGGDLLVSAEGEAWLPHLPVEAVDATGAGDAFAAALAVCLARGDELGAAARFASAAAAVKTTRLGAQAGLPTNSEVLRALARFESRP